MFIIKRIKWKRLSVPLIITTIVSVVFCLPILRNITYWGQMDWDEVFFWGGVARKTILEYHQFPLWNPYCQGEGALVFIAYPNSYFLSPFFLFILIFGPVFGAKLLVIIHLIIGLWGMFLLARYYNIGKVSSWLVSFIYMLSSVYFLHLTEGHFGWLTMAFVPWFFLTCLKSLKDSKYIFAAVFFLSLILLGGSVDVFSIIIPFVVIFSFFLMLQERKIGIFKKVLLIFIVTFLACSVKLLPMLEYLSQYPRLVDSAEGTAPSLLSAILLEREQGRLYSETKWHYSENKTAVGEKLGIDYGWHEYGAYIGIIPLILFGLGMLALFRRQWPLLATGGIFLLLALGNKSPINLWRLLHSLPLYDCLRVPSRFIIGFIFPLSLFAGFGLSILERKGNLLLNILVIFTTGFILFDLWQVSGSILKQAFTIPPPVEVKKNPVFSQYRDFDEHTYKYGMRGGRYLAFLANKGITKKIYNDIPVPQGEVMTKDDVNYKGEAYLAGDNGNTSIPYFSPNKIVVDVKVKKQDILVLNQKYYRGWRIKGNKKMKLEPYNGLISAKLFPGEYRLIFYYLPFSFIIGIIISFSTIVTILNLWRKFLKKEQKT